MGEKTKIAWTDYTFSPWIGCAKVSAGCANCYAEREFDKRRHRAAWGRNGTRSLTNDAYWRQPFRWKSGRVFCASLCDVFEDWHDSIVDHRGREVRRCEWCDRLVVCPDDACHACIPPRTTVMATMSDVRTRLWDLIGKTIHLDWQLLTKRPENVLRMVPDEWLRDWPAHVWLGTSVEDQDAADKRIPELLKIPAGVRFLSVEPLLRPVDLSGLLLGIHWIICGAESGPHRRPCKIEWVESIVNQCCAAGVKCFVKQVSINGRVSKNPDEWPGNLRIREFPNALQGP